MGVWIETFIFILVCCNRMSHPMWVCGLKPWIMDEVAGLMSSHPMWVCGLKRSPTTETPADVVTPHVGVWIETGPWPINVAHGDRHTPCGCVD